LRGYFRDHGQDFGAGSQEEYARLESLFLQDAPRRNLPMKIDKDGIIRIYDPTTNTSAPIIQMEQRGRSSNPKKVLITAYDSMEDPLYG
jgi:pyocin large subunit-like protein